METETTRSDFPYVGKAIVEQILASEERDPKEQDYENQSGIPVGELTQGGHPCLTFKFPDFSRTSLTF